MPLTILADDLIRFYRVELSHGEPFVVSLSDAEVDFNKGVKHYLEEKLARMSLVPPLAIVTHWKEVEYIEAGDVVTLVRGIKVEGAAA